MGRKKYPDVFEDLPQEASPTNTESPEVHDEPQTNITDAAAQDDLANYADINLTLKENLPLFDKVAKNQDTIIERQTTIENGMKTIASNQVFLAKQMLNFDLSDAKQTEAQGKFDDMAIRSANKFVNAVQDRCDRYIKRIESSDQAFIIPPVAAWCLFIIFFSLVAFFGLVVISNALVWKSRMIWQITAIISAFAVFTVSVIILVYKYLMKDNSRRY